MTKLWDIKGFDESELAFAIEMGYVTNRHHPRYDLSIINYTDKAQYTPGIWNATVRACRGLIVDGDMNIVARPFPKFFNYGQLEAAEIPLNAPVVVTDKLDGSLGIIYETPDNEFAVATRGSFVSEQAIKATEMLRRMEFAPFPGATYLVEIIYPENRVVVNYGDEEKLVLLGTVSNDDGTIGSAHDAVLYGEWYGPIVDTSIEYQTLASALLAEPRPNAEGIVVRDLNTNAMVKIKQEDYVRLHKLVFGLSEKAVWEHLSTHNGDISEMLEGLPDEFHEWVLDKAYWLKREHQKIKDSALYLYDTTKRAKDFTRKDFALWAQKFPDYRSYLFMLLDGKSIDAAIWRSLKPKGTNHLKEVSEDVA